MRRLAILFPLLGCLISCGGDSADTSSTPSAMTVSLSGSASAQIWQGQCAACHGTAGEGNRALGAPALTQLSSHASFLQRLEAEVVSARKTGRNFCVILVDLDGFTDINVQHGFRVGDEFLRQVASIFQRQLRDAVEVARVGPDSFAALLRRADE